MRYAFICDVDASGLPQVLIVKDTKEEVVEAALEVFDERFDKEVPELPNADDGPGIEDPSWLDVANNVYHGETPEDEEWSFWAEEEDGNFEKLGYFTHRVGLLSFFDPNDAEVA